MSDSSTASAGREGDRGPRLQATVAEIRETYETQADRMARLSWLNRLVTGRYRRRLFGDAGGRVLDVACGTGLNLRYLPDGVEYVGADVSPVMLARARERHGGPRGVTFVEMDAGTLALAEDSFDTVISSLSTCTFPDSTAALREMGRVCRSEGRVCLLEHGRSDVGPVARFQDWRADAHFEKHACRWNQQPTETVAAAGLAVRRTVSDPLGVLTGIEAAP